MEKFKYEMKEAGFSNKYFENASRAVLTEISEWDFRVTSLNTAEFYSELYAEARLHDASVKFDMSVTKREKEKWISEHDRWYKAVLQAQEGDYSHLSGEIRVDAVDFVKNSENDEEGSFATALFRISEVIAEGEQKK